MSKPSVVMMLNSYQIYEKSFFENFKNINNLEEKECFRITGWSKKKFIQFSRFITSINDTGGRTKEQLIALYRYWLRKGIDQYTLSRLFKNNVSQNQISHYLSQIRSAIYKDFVPFFLGSNKPREFYLRHNNSTTIELYDLKNDDLVIIVDATYTRLEKSSNNEFQYNCWSEQKNDLLIKPFLICCADGYIIDCYGPFCAHHNDAKIFEYILKEDKVLLKILLPFKTIVLLDRGKKIE
jgi:hypothetical protein